MKADKGFVGIGVLLVCIVVAAVIGGGYVVLKSKKNSETSVGAGTRTAASGSVVTQPTGSADGAVLTVERQLDTEVAVEDDGASEEATQTQINTNSLKNVENSINASNL